MHRKLSYNLDIYLIKDAIYNLFKQKKNFLRSIKIRSIYTFAVFKIKYRKIPKL